LAGFESVAPPAGTSDEAPSADSPASGAGAPSKLAGFQCAPSGRFSAPADIQHSGSRQKYARNIKRVRFRKDYERLPETAETLIYIRMIHLMSRRLAKHRSSL
jgi:hypothetical protein